MSKDKKIEDLLKPRVKIIAPWPGMEEDDYKVGQIVTGDSELNLNTEMIEKHPHLFKLLEWWEERKPEEMPEYVKFTNSVSAEYMGFVRKVEKWEGSLEDWRAYFDGYKFKWLHAQDLFPATEAEYLNIQIPLSGHTPEKNKI